MDFGGRKEIFRALVGSHNYNLNTPESDKDYKVFVAPTFDDLYFNQQFSKSYIGETEDFDVHDIRKLTNLFWKSNVNFLEVLYSNDLKVFSVNSGLYTETEELVDNIISIRDEIVKMNLPYLYDACVGMHINKKKLVIKGTEGTQYLVDKYGYDTKQAMHSIRILDFLIRFADYNFDEFKSAIHYQDMGYGKRFLLDIKNGKFTLDEYYKEAERILNFVDRNYKVRYKNQKPNEETNEKLLNIVKEIVKFNI